MRHIKTINELLKSTYLSASKSLHPSHPKRAKALIDYAIEQGEDVTSHDRIYPHRFLFDNYPNEYFFITDYNYKQTQESGSYYLWVSVEMISNWGNDKKFTLAFQIFSLEKYKIDVPYLRLRMVSDRFTNSDAVVARKNANHMIKFFKECWEDNIRVDYPNYIIKDLSVNNLYKSE